MLSPRIQFARMASISICGGATDSMFGPRVDPCIRQFDFILIFENSILSILPSCMFILLSCRRIIQLYQVSIKVQGSTLHLVKLLAITILGSLSLILLVLRASEARWRSNVALVADTLNLVGMLLLGLLSHFEHRRSIRTSLLVGTYLATTALFDVVRIRTLWLKFGTVDISIVFTISLAAKIGVLTTEAVKKRRHLVQNEKDASSEETSGLFNLAFFLWPLGLIKTGFRKVLLGDDLPTIDRGLAPGKAQQRFLAIWNSSKFDKLFAPIIPRLFLIGFTYSQPVLLNKVVMFVQSDQGDELNGDSIGYGLIGAYFLVYTGFAVSTAQYWHQTDRFTTLVRGNLVAMIYDKSLTLGTDKHKYFSAITLMSTDVERIVNGVKNLHESWASLIELAMGLYLLQTQIGLACFTPLVLAVIISITVSKTAPLSSRYQKRWLEANQERIDRTSKMLGSMKIIRMRGITEKVHSIIQRSRVSELKKAGGFRMMMIVGVAQSFALSTLAPVITFLVYCLYSQSHHANFVQLSTRPTITTLTSTPAMISALSCFSRIQEFLISEDALNCRSEPSSNGTNRPTGDIKFMSSGILPLLEAEVAMTKASSSNFSTAVPLAISIHNGSFGWKKHDQPFLRDVNLEIKQGDVAMIVGPIGSGKSTLLQGLLGETSLIGGKILLQPSKVAYAAQVAWLRNGTIRENIVGFLDFDKDWYDTVVQVCELQMDLERLPQGDRTEVGSKGSSLSGGQKQRLAIARAVYTRAKIFLFDDIFSSLDTPTTDSIFDNLSGPQGILRRLQATVVYVTHAVHLLSHADHVIALDEGSISEQGSFTRLITLQGYVHKIHSEGQGLKPSEAAKEVEAIQKIAPDHRLAGPTTDEVANKPSSIKRVEAYKFYIKSFGTLNTIFFFILMLAAAFTLNFPTVWLEMWSQASLEEAQYPIQVSALLVVCYSCWFYFMDMVAKSGEDLHTSMLQTVGSTTGTGTTTTRFSQDIMLIDTELPYAFLDASINVLDCSAILIIIAVSSPYIAISCPFLLVIFWFIQKVYLRTSSQIRLLELAAKGPLVTQFLETVDGLVTIRALGWQQKINRQQHQLIENSQRPFYLLLTIQRWLTLVLDLLVAGMAVLLVVLAVRLKNVSAGFSGVALVNIISLSSSIASVITSWTKLETSLGAIFRIVEFCTQTPKESGDLLIEDAPRSWPSKGAIKFDNVTASYGVDKSSVLRGISFSVKAGEKIGVYGRTGSGKSSLLNVLFRMIDMTTGSISIDGTDLADLPKHQVRSRLICVPQESYVIPGDVRSNLDIEGISSDSEIIAALETVQLWEVIREAGGLSSEMKSDLLSPGQSQLFSLARALLHRSRILILDEATSSVDIRTEQLMNRVIRERFSEHTVIAIAHRVAAAQDFDRIVVLDGGHLLAFGPFAEISKYLATGFSD
ncbi:putative ABC multidrug transporter [Hyaloscypha variabilis]